MTRNLTAQDILVIHVFVCEALGSRVELMKPRVLNDIESQLKTNLNWFSSIEVAAYVGLQITKRKPFKSANNATATALTIALLGANKNINVQAAFDALESSSVVEDVADQLVLIGE